MANEKDSRKRGVLKPDMKGKDKTNVMRVLDGKKISYESHSYEPDPTMSGEQIAEILGENAEKVFKTLVIPHSDKRLRSPFIR